MRHKLTNGLVATLAVAILSAYMGLPLFAQVGGGGVRPAPNTHTGNVTVSGTLDVTGAVTANANFEVSSATPYVDISDTNATADENVWRFFGGSGQLLGQALTDDKSAGNQWLTVDRTGTTVDAVALAATDVTVNGASIAAESGTFEAQYDDACTTTPSQTVNYMRIGNLVTLRFVDNITCTSDATAFATTGTPVPSAIRPTADVMLGGFQVVDNSTTQLGCAKITSAGNVVIHRDPTPFGQCGSTWTGSGTKTFVINTSAQNVLSYTLN